MKFSLIHFYKTPLCMAVEKGNIAVVQLLLERKEISVNMTSILTLIFFYKILKKIIIY